MNQQLTEDADSIDNSPEESKEKLSEDTKSCHELQSQILKVLEELRDDERNYLLLRRLRLGIADDIPRISRELWENGTNAWVGHDFQYWTDLQPGRSFLASLVPDTTNLQSLKDIVEDIAKEQREEYRADWSRFINGARSHNHICRQDILICDWLKNFECPFDFRKVYSNGDLHSFNLDLRREIGDACGIIAQFSINRFFDVIDPESATAIISLLRSDCGGCDLDFLDGHIADWRKQPEVTQGGPGVFILRDSPPVNGRDETVQIESFTHHMRSFTVVSPNGETANAKPPVPGFKCLRENKSFWGFYSAIKTELIEKRYSTALKLLPLQKPAGHYALVSIYDGMQQDAQFVFHNSPGYTGHTLTSWEQYNIYPAGLNTGISMFQLQICVFIDSWEQDWILTMKQIDEMVTLKFNVLEDDMILRKLVLENSTDASVLYFKVLQILNNFSDVVRAAPSRLDMLSNVVRLKMDSQFAESYPYTENTKHIVKHNWDVVRERQRDASSRILAKLERTTNEVKSLQSGLFNVQSITEARKSRTLNKYLLVFTIVTILFLPPTFVATFFGMHIFDANTIGTTQRLFWAVLGALSGGTYLLAALGLFGSHLSAEERNPGLRIPNGGEEKKEGPRGLIRDPFNAQAL
ncbi:hypothetical protein F4860DRAFT_513772 [Xylaria cubensis]|nr:hypothetical protein F4860DRAFT_513772 [Xylaria cubensis]